LGWLTLPAMLFIRIADGLLQGRAKRATTAEALAVDEHRRERIDFLAIGQRQLFAPEGLTLGSIVVAGLDFGSVKFGGFRAPRGEFLVAAVFALETGDEIDDAGLCLGAAAGPRWARDRGHAHLEFVARAVGVHSLAVYLLPRQRADGCVIPKNFLWEGHRDELEVHDGV
jgi:hypothetical protein